MGGEGARAQNRGGDGQRSGDWECPGCPYNNFGHRQTCRKCGTKRGPGGGERRAKGTGKGTNGGGGGGSGGGAGGANAWGAGGLAQRQLQAQREGERKLQSALDKEKHERKKDADRLQKLQKELEAARKSSSGGGSSDQHVKSDKSMDEDDDDPAADDARLQTLSNELSGIEALLKVINNTSPLHPNAIARSEQIKADMAEIKNRRDSPEDKILGLAGRHARDLRNARNKFLKKQRAVTKVTEEHEQLEKELRELTGRRDAKKLERAELQEEFNAAKAEVERLSKTKDGDAALDESLGPRARAQVLAEELGIHLPSAELKGRLNELLNIAFLHKENAKAAQQPPREGGAEAQGQQQHPQGKSPAAQAAPAAPTPPHPQPLGAAAAAPTPPAVALAAPLPTPAAAPATAAAADAPADAGSATSPISTPAEAGDAGTAGGADPASEEPPVSKKHKPENYDMEVEDALAMLPDAQQRKVRAALRWSLDEESNGKYQERGRDRTPRRPEV